MAVLLKPGQRGFRAATPQDLRDNKMMLGITNDHQIIVDFGRRLKWVKFKPRQCREIARMMLSLADEAEKAQVSEEAKHDAHDSIEPHGTA